jgi:hypothetical protein
MNSFYTTWIFIFLHYFYCYIVHLYERFDITTKFSVVFVICNAKILKFLVLQI